MSEPFVHSSEVDPREKKAGEFLGVWRGRELWTSGGSRTDLVECLRWALGRVAKLEAALQRRPGP